MRTQNGQFRLLLLLTICAGLVVIALGCRSAPQLSAPTASAAPNEAAPFEPLQQHAADLAACSAHRPPIRAVDKIDVHDLARRLHGSWILDSRTIQGLVIDTNTVFKFDFEQVDAAAGKATALLIDEGNLSVQDPLRLSSACQADATVAALWSVQLRRDPAEKATLVMDGEYFGSYGEFLDGVRFTEQLEFVRQGTKYYSGKLVTPGGGFGVSDDLWDLVSLTENRLTYVSCKNRVVENYVKVDSGRPTVDGLSLRDAWEKRKRDGTVTVPIPVEPSWKRRAGVIRR